MKKYLMVALLPILAYIWVIGGFSVGEDCFRSIWGEGPLPQDGYFCQQQKDTGAYIDQLIPEWKEVGRSYLSGKIPWWDAHSGLGAPLAANFISGAFYPPTILANLDQSLLFGRWWMVFRLAIGAVGVYWLLNILGMGGWAGVAGAGLMVFNGYISQLFSIHHHDIDMYLPWIIGAIILAGKKKRYWIPAGLLLGLTVLAGMPESTIFVWLAAGVSSFFLALTTKGRNFMNRFGGPVVMLLIGWVVAAILIIPGWEFIHQGASLRSVFPNGGQVYFVGLRNLIFWLLPKITGPFKNILAQQRSTEILSLNYWGISAFVLIGYVGMKKGRATTYLLLGLLVIYFGILPVPWSAMPFFKDIIFVKYSLGLINFLAVIELARGIIYWSKADFNEKQKIILMMWLVILGLLLGFYKDWHLITRSGMKLAALQVGILIIISWLLPRLRRTSAIMAVVVIELLLYLPWLGVRSWGYQIEQPKFVTWLQKHTGPQERIFGIEGQIYPNWSGIFDLNDVRYIGPLWPKYYVNYIREFVQPDIDKGIMRFGSSSDAIGELPTKISDNEFFDLLGVKYLISRNIQKDKNWKLVYDNEEKIYENINSVPRFRFVLKTICSPDDETTILLMKSRVKSLLETAIVSGNNCGSYKKGSITGIRSGQNALEISYENENSGYLVVSDNWYPGWQAFVNGNEIKIDRVDLTFRGIALPAGKNNLIMTYTPSFLQWKSGVL